MARKISLSGKRPKSFRDYLSAIGDNYPEKFENARVEAKISRDRAAGGYGSDGASLKEAGLSRSGYTEYLERVADGKLAKALGNINEAERKSELEARSKYAKYLDSYAAESERKRQQTVKQMLSDRRTPTEDLFSIAKSYGLDSDSAALAAGEVKEESTERIIEELLPTLYYLSAGEETARDKGTEVGLDEEGLRRLIKRLREHYSSYQGYHDSYLDYLESIGSLVPYPTLSNS